MIIIGSRGAFINVDRGDFNFVLNRKLYESIGKIGEVNILIKCSGSVKTPEYSHSSNSVYAIIQKGKLKHLAFYDYNHKQIKSIDFLHTHGINKVIPHVHFNLNHDKSEIGTPPSELDWEIIN